MGGAELAALDTLQHCLTGDAEGGGGDLDRLQGGGHQSQAHSRRNSLESRMPGNWHLRVRRGAVRKRTRELRAPRRTAYPNRVSSKPSLYLMDFRQAKCEYVLPARWAWKAWSLTKPGLPAC